jgi:hypothetical protein
MYPDPLAERRMVTTLHDRPQAPYRLDTFINVADEARLLTLFYDEQLRHRLNKVVPLEPGATLPVLSHALRYARSIPAERFDFDAAKAAVLERTQL